MNLKQSIINLRVAIRKHRDQKGDDRCWVDDYWLYDLLPGNKKRLPSHIAYEEGMQCCIDFFEHRKSEPVYVQQEKTMIPEYKDDDLDVMNNRELTLELARLRHAIKQHMHISRKKTLQDDKLLYFVLPEKVPADFRLPNRQEFIEGVKSGCGCPNFWKSHEQCSGEHNYHAWGPCH